MTETEDLCTARACVQQIWVYIEQAMPKTPATGKQVPGHTRQIVSAMFCKVLS